MISVILGKSGSGKSTLLQTINGLLQPSGGSILLFGKPIDYNNIYHLRREIGYAVQGTGLFPHLTVRENIALPARVSGKTGEWLEERIDHLMQLVNLDLKYKSRYPYQLSGGEEQRVGICRAMVLNPPIFLLDEAFAALDPTTKNEIHNEVLKIQHMEPRTIVMVTHDLAEAVKLADKIMVIHEGEIQQYGRKYEILNSPANDYVRDFIKSQETV